MSAQARVQPPRGQADGAPDEHPLALVLFGFLRTSLVTRWGVWLLAAVAIASAGGAFLAIGSGALGLFNMPGLHGVVGGASAIVAAGLAHILGGAMRMPEDAHADPSAMRERRDV